MWPVATQRPTIETGTSVVGQTTSFAAVLSDDRWKEEEMEVHVQNVKARLMVDNQQNQENNRISRMLIVSTPEGPQGQTLVYFNLARADQLHTAKRLLGKYFSSCGDHVKNRVIHSAHMFNYRDEQHILQWKMLEFDEATEDIHIAATTTQQLKALRDAGVDLDSDDTQGTMMVYQGAGALVKFESKAREDKEGIRELEDKLETLKLESEERTQHPTRE